MNIFNIFRKKHPETEVTSFEIRYELVLKDNIDEHSKKNAIRSCSDKKVVEDELDKECRVCLKLLDEKKYWTRKGIEMLSQKLGYSVYDNPGGGCDENGYPVCACEWKQVTIIKNNNEIL
jgi:hypothetical protein